MCGRAFRASLLRTRVGLLKKVSKVLFGTIKHSQKIFTAVKRILRKVNTSLRKVNSSLRNVKKSKMVGCDAMGHIKNS
jgi:hypothetical protein